VAAPYVVGLTGGIACGKSSVCAILRQQGVPICDADALARSITEPTTLAYKMIVNHFGSACLNPDKTLDRRYLRTRIFSDPTERKWLENLLHPLIHEACLQTLMQLPPDTAYVVLDIPLLTESQLHYPVDTIWVVDAKPEIQQARLRARDTLSESLISAILSAQAPRAERLAKANVIIENNQSLADLQRVVLALHKKILKNK
jgi:dephospho-CoA kinase